MWPSDLSFSDLVAMSHHQFINDNSDIPTWVLVPVGLSIHGPYSSKLWFFVSAGLFLQDSILPYGLTPLTNLRRVTDFFSLFSFYLLGCSQSVSQFSRSVMSDSLRPHESQHARPPCPSPTPGVHSDLHPSSQWCHPAISSSVVPFSSCPQSLPGSESFPMSQDFALGGQSTGVSALA